MQPSEFSDQMRRLSDAYGRPVDDDQVEAWFDTFEAFALPSLANAIADWVRTQSRFPTIADLLPLVQGHARRVAAERTAPEHGRLATPEFVAPYLALIAEHKGRVPTVEHDHHHGWQGCPICSTTSERQEWLRGRLAGLASVGPRA